MRSSEGRRRRCGLRPRRRTPDGRGRGLVDLGRRSDASLGLEAVRPATSLRRAGRQRPARRDARPASGATGRARPQPARDVRQPGRAGRGPGATARAGPAGPPARGGGPLAQRADGRGVARPAHAAGVHQDGRLEPAPARCAAQPGGPGRAPRAHRDPVGPPGPTGDQPPRHDAASRRVRSSSACRSIAFDELVDEALGPLGGDRRHPDGVTVDAAGDLPLAPHRPRPHRARSWPTCWRTPSGSPPWQRHPGDGAARTRATPGREIAVADDGPGIAGRIERECSRCSARTAAAAGPGSVWPSPRRSSRPTVGHLDRPRRGPWRPGRVHHPRRGLRRPQRPEGRRDQGPRRR